MSLHANASVRAGMTGAEVFYLISTSTATPPRAWRAARASRCGLWWRDTRYRTDPLGNGAGAIHPGIGGARPAIDARAGARADEPARDSTGAVRVLVGANMPAVLVEMGSYQCGPGKQLLSTSSIYDREGLVESITRFRDARGAARSSGAR